MTVAPHDRAISLFPDETCFLERDDYVRAHLDKVHTHEENTFVEER